MKRSLALMACVLSSAMVLTTVSPVMAADKEKTETADTKEEAGTEETKKDSDTESTALEDGIYSAEFDTDSNMFHVNEANDGKGTLTVKDGKMTGEVESLLFKGVHYEIMVETVPGTHVTVNMHVNKNYAITSEDGKEKISANDFYLDLEDMKDIDDKEIIARADAQAWNPETDEFISIHDIDTDLKQEVGEYTVTFSTNNKTSITRKIWVVDQRVVENKKANEAVSAFNFFKTVDEIKESMAIDTDLKTWANAQGWKLDDENETVDLDVDYDFDPETIKEGVYKVTFWTTGREFKIHTTDYVEEGKEVGLTFFAEDIHVMEKMGF